MIPPITESAAVVDTSDIPVETMVDRLAAVIEGRFGAGAERRSA